MTAHAERVGVLALLGVLMLVGWCAVALGVAADSNESGARAVGAVVSKREGSTTIVIGGPFAAAAIVVANAPDQPDAVPADESSDAAPRVVSNDHPVIFGSVAIFSSPAAPDGVTVANAVPDGVPAADVPAADVPAADVPAADFPAAHDAAMLLDGVSAPESAGSDGSAVIMEADRILADSAALEELWRLPAATAEQRRPVTKQA
jgi:hypothetical protein